MKNTYNAYLLKDLSRVRTIMGELNDLMDTIQQNPACPDVQAKIEMLHGYDSLDAGSTELLTESLKREQRTVALSTLLGVGIV